MKDEEKVALPYQSGKEEHYKKYSIASSILGIVSIVFHIPILCGTLAIGLGVLSMKNGRKVFSTIGIILGAIGIVLTAAITINVLSFVASSSLTFIIWKVKTKNKLKLIV